ncbi:MAG: transglycosylase domain-containing protein [Nitrospira sp.]|nr:transglycosylase domain-containing protein [Nitrospira sp.]
MSLRYGRYGLRKVTYWIFLSAILVILMTVAGIMLWISNLADQIPDDRVITDFTHNAVTVIYDKDGRLLVKLVEDKNQVWVPLSDMSEFLKKGIIATEDPYFFKHGGIDYRQTWESLKDNLRVWRFVRGGSTLTQQVAKNVYLSKEKTLARKVKEYFLAKKIESLLPKERILEIYLNEIGWGYGIYGVELASRFYLDKHAYELNTAESAFLIAMVRNPALYNPYKYMDKVIKRQQLVLSLMLGHRAITKEEYDAAFVYPVTLRLTNKYKRFHNIRLDKQDDDKRGLPCYAGLMEGYLLDTFGRNILYDVGLEVYTTIDRSVQYRLEGIIKRAEIGEKKNNRDGVQIGQIGLVKDARGKVRAIGCTGRWANVSEEMKKDEHPFNLNLYTSEVTTGKKISWKDILLVSKGDRLL